MCLSSVTKHMPCKRGFKVVKVDAVGNYRPVFRFTGKIFPIGVWLHEKDYRDDPGDSIMLELSMQTYPMGFHVYHHKKDARSFRDFTGRIVCVQVREPVVVGIQGTVVEAKVTVAKQIKIGKEVD